ncbi:cell division protein FtsQ/DivIB [Deinococcus alpinitundrae]|uniref:cell division protein FtsQ/DivIB n=1 Tax=Deinococcus alpinitundrae TaxID=468913 RepID=UPI001ED9418A|nr:FtsQ-type POTRA domain-containing protein [Deinococcus alpinitundrae]
MAVKPLPPALPQALGTPARGTQTFSPAPFDLARRRAPQIAPIPAPPQPSAQLPSVPPDAPLPRRRFWQQYGVFLSVILSALILAGGGFALWRYLPIRTVQISGNRHLSSLEVKRLAGLSGERPFGWAYYGAWRAGALRDNAWVASAQLTRVFPDRVEVHLSERVPVAQVRARSGALSVIAADGTVLPGAAPTGPIISGWGPDRTADALFAARALARYNVESVTYTPTGITVQTNQGTIWSGDRALLLKYGQAIETQAQGGRINLYPWGVSVQR